MKIDVENPDFKISCIVRGISSNHSLSVLYFDFFHFLLQHLRGIFNKKVFTPKGSLGFIEKFFVHLGFRISLD